MTESALSGEVSAVTILPGPVDLTPEKTADGAELAWTKADDSPDGSVAIERSDDGGSTWSTIDSGLPASTESYTDTAISEGDQIVYRVVRSTDHATVSATEELVGAEYQVQIVGTNSPVQAGESLEVAVQVDNLGGRGSQPVSLTVEEQ